MQRSVGFMVAGLSLAAPVGAYAADFGLRMDSGFFITAGAGKARTSIDCTGAICDQTDTSWSVSAGYQFNRNFAGEIGYTDLGKTTTTVTFTGVGAVTAITEAKAVELTGTAMIPLSDRFALYAKGGLYRSDAKSTGVAGPGIGSGNANGTGFTFGLGMQYSITPNLGARFEWQNYNGMNTGVVGFPEADYNVWRLGARYKF